MRYDYKVCVEDPHGRWQGVLCTNDLGIAVLTADTREAGVSSRVIGANGNVIHERDANTDDLSVDLGQPVARV